MITNETKDACRSLSLGFVAFLMALVARATVASAICSAPTGVDGQFQYFSTSQDFQFCNGTTWVSSAVTTTGFSCSVAGMLQYQSGSTDLQFCNGSRWVSTTSTLSNGSCSGTAVGTWQYNMPTNSMRWCDGSTWWIMYAQPTLRANFMNGTWPVEIGFGRASGANVVPGTYVSSSGTIVTAGSNMALSSQIFTNATYWAVPGATVTGATFAAPDGSSTASFVAEDSSTGQHMVQAKRTFPGGASYRLSIYAKAGTRSRIFLFGSNATDGNLGATEFNLTNGTAVGGGAIQNVGNGWYRCSITMSPTVTTSWPGFKIYNGPGGWSYTGDGSSGVYMWGAQLEPGSTTSPYTATTTSIVYLPRLDHNPTSVGSLNGLLIEEQRTNSVRQSEVFAGTFWATSLGYGFGTTSNVMDNQAVAPDGTTSAAQVTFTGAPQSRLFQDVTVSGATISYVVSAFVKDVSAGSVTLTLDVVNTNTRWSANYPNVKYIFGTDTVICNALSCGRTLYPNSWVRIWAVETSKAGGSFTASTGNILWNTGSVYVWGHQLEQGSTVSSYVPTGTIAMTRMPDIVSAGTFGSWFSASNSTVYASILVPNYGINVYPWVASFNDGTATNNYGAFLHAPNAGQAHVKMISAGATIYTPGTSNTATAGAVSGVAFTTSAGTAAIAVSGGASVAAPGTTNPAVNRMSIGYSPNGTYLNGWMRSFDYYNLQMTHHQIESLSGSGLP